MGSIFNSLIYNCDGINDILKVTFYSNAPSPIERHMIRNWGKCKIVISWGYCTKSLNAHILDIIIIRSTKRQTKVTNKNIIKRTNANPRHLGTDLDISDSVLGPVHFGTDLDISVLGTASAIVKYNKQHYK